MVLGIVGRVQQKHGRYAANAASPITFAAAYSIVLVLCRPVFCCSLLSICSEESRGS